MTISRVCRVKNPTTTNTKKPSISIRDRRAKRRDSVGVEEGWSGMAMAPLHNVLSIIPRNKEKVKGKLAKRRELQGEGISPGMARYTRVTILK